MSKKFRKNVQSALKGMVCCSIALSTCFTGGLTTYAATAQTIQSTPDYSVKAVQESETMCTIVFTPSQTMDIVDIHFKVNGGGQQNFRMNHNGNEWTYTIENLTNNDIIDASFTYIVSGVGHDSDIMQYIVVSPDANNDNSSSNSGTIVETPSVDVPPEIIPVVDTSIPKKDGKITFQFNNKTNGAYSDSQIYWCILGYNSNNELCYVNAQGDLIKATTALNTIEKGDRKCANIYNTVAQNKYVYMPSITSGRMYISYGEPVYITINEAADGRIGFAGPDMNNPTDPNQNVLFEFLEFTIGSAASPVEYWGNTTRVDNFCFPIVTRLLGENGSTNGISYDVYDKTVGDLGTRAAIFESFKNNAPNEFKDLVGEHRIVAPCKGSFNEGQANANYLQGIIDEFWNKFANQDLKFECQGGNFVARTYGNEIRFTELRSGQTGTVQKPNTQEVLEGKGAFDRGTSIELVFEAQLCAAFNRGVALHPEDWYTPSKYYPEGVPCNYYSKFWHENSVEGLAYGFCYDDVNEQATLLHFTNPTTLAIDLKW